MTDHQSRSLRRWNIALALLHAGQAAFILVLSTGFSLPIFIPYMDGPPGSPLVQGNPVWELPIALAVALFLLLAAVDHLIVALPRVRTWHEANLMRGTNPVRWSEYALSASLMMVLIAMITGIADASALIAIFGANAAMILFGLVMEQRNGLAPDRVDWRPFIYGCLVGAVPWIAVGLVLVRAEMMADVPGFVYGIYISLLVLFFSFAVNMWRHYRRVSRGVVTVVQTERIYLVLSLVAKSLLAWQIFASTLAG